MKAEESHRIVAIHQPNYLPWLGYFYKIYQSDVFVFLDDVQYSNEGMHNYTYIKTPNGPFRLKYPVFQRFGDKICDVRPKDELGWKKDHLNNISSNYKKAEYFDMVFNDYERLIMNEYQNLVELNISIIKFFADKLGFSPEYLKSSDLDINLKRTEKIIAVCKKVKADIYYSGTGAKAYQTGEEFGSEGIDLRYSIFKPFPYKQLWAGFQSNVTALDFFMNCGYDWQQVLRNQ
jgi:hypothetical protein